MNLLLIFIPLILILILLSLVVIFNFFRYRFQNDRTVVIITLFSIAFGLILFGTFFLLDPSALAESTSVTRF